MLKACAVLAVVAAVLMAYCLTDGTVTPVARDFWAPRAPDSGAVTPFTVPYDASMIDDLRTRLNNTREAIFLDACVGDWSYGVNRTFLRAALSSWRERPTSR